MKNKLLIAGIGCCLSMVWGQQALAQANVEALSQLGKQVFYDKISVPETQACVSCHHPKAGWTLKKNKINRTQVVAPGAVVQRAGNRKPPMISYASFSPNFTSCDGTFPVLCSGGIFWDGRAKGDAIGEEVFAGNLDLMLAYSQFLGPAADQALGPFANPVEQNLPVGYTEIPGAEAACSAVANAQYARLYSDAWGEVPDCSLQGADLSFKRIAVAISAWEHSDEVNSFSSIRDIALADDEDGIFPLDGFTAEENEGHDLFYGIALCSGCHDGAPAGDMTSGSGDEPRQLYTDNRFHHLGLPPNTKAANYDPNNPDRGLAAISGDTLHESAFRTPSLRNVDQRPRENFTKAYMHNGYFKNLEDVVHFYNTATSKRVCKNNLTAAKARRRNCWPAAEIDNGLQSSAFGLLGNLGLTPDQEAALVVYLKTLTDTNVVKKPKKVR